MAEVAAEAEVMEHWEGGEGQASVFHPHAVSGSSFYSGPPQLLIRVHSDLVSPVVVAAAAAVVAAESVQDAVAQVSLFRSLHYVS